MHDSETPAYNSQVITACALIHHDFNGVRKVFLPKRASTKKFLPNVYELPGGHIDWGENLIEGLKREIREEFEMGVSVGDPFAAFTYKNEVKGSHSVEVVYFAKFTDPLEKIVVHADDHSEFCWVSEVELADFVGKLSDEEFKNVAKGLALLRGEEHHFE